MVNKIAEYVAANKLPIEYREKDGIITITPKGLDIDEIDDICIKFGGTLIDGRIVIKQEA